MSLLLAYLAIGLVMYLGLLFNAWDTLAFNRYFQPSPLWLEIVAHCVVFLLNLLIWPYVIYHDMRWLREQEADHEHP